MLHVLLLLVALAASVSMTGAPVFFFCCAAFDVRVQKVETPNPQAGTQWKRCGGGVHCCFGSSFLNSNRDGRGCRKAQGSG